MRSRKDIQIIGKVNELELEVKKLVKSKEVIKPCKKSDVLTKEVDFLKCNVSRLQDEALNFSKFKRSSVVLDDMLSHQKLSKDKEEPKNIMEDIKDESWTMAMQEELDQFIRNDVWDLVSCPLDHVQSKYIAEMLKKLGLENTKITTTPMYKKRVLTLDKDSESIDSTKYRGMESVNEGEMEESSKKLKRIFETMKRYECDERIMFEFILRDFVESEIYDKVKEPLSPRLNEDE
ncbi:hypothetical protein Tco_0363008 [Tanacetum coccineum]